MQESMSHASVTAFLQERSVLGSLVREVYEGYLRTGGKAVFAREQTAADLALTSRSVKAWVSPSDREYITSHGMEAARAGILSGHQAWLLREAQRLADRADALRARMPTASVATLRSVG